MWFGFRSWPYWGLCSSAAALGTPKPPCSGQVDNWVGQEPAPKRSARTLPEWHLLLFFFQGRNTTCNATLVMYGDNFYVATDNLHRNTSWNSSTGAAVFRCSASALFCHLVFDISNFNFSSDILSIVSGQKHLKIRMRCSAKGVWQKRGKTQYKWNFLCCKWNGSCRQ